MIYLLSILALPYLVADAAKRYNKSIAESDNTVGKENTNVKDTNQ